MAEPTIQDVFGAAATQTATTLTISKADLQARGLTPSATNTAESLLVSIVLQAAESLTETSRAADTANRGVTLLYQGQDLIETANQVYRRDAFSVLLYKQTSYTTVDPDDY